MNDFLRLSVLCDPFATVCEASQLIEGLHVQESFEAGETRGKTDPSIGLSFVRHDAGSRNPRVRASLYKSISVMWTFAYCLLS